MRLLLIFPFLFLSFGCYASALVASDHFSSPLSIHSSIQDTVAPNINLPEGAERLSLEKEEKKYRLWTKLSLASSWATLVFFFLSVFFSPLWGVLCFVTIILSIVMASDVLRETKHRAPLHKVRKWAKWSLFIPILYIIASIIGAINLVFLYLGD